MADRLASEFIKDFDVLAKRNMALNSYCNEENGSFQLMVNNNRRANYFEVENGKMVLFIKYFFSNANNLKITFKR